MQDALLTMLDTMALGGYDCSFGDMANELRGKIMKYGRKRQRVPAA